MKRFINLTGATGIFGILFSLYHFNFNCVESGLLIIYLIVFIWITIDNNLIDDL